MKDRLLYLTIGLLIGVVVMQWTMPSGRASVVLEEAGIVAMHSAGLSSALLLDQTGAVWLQSDPSACWQREARFDVPISGASIKFWTPYQLVSKVDHAWVLSDTGNGNYAWHDCGRWPGGSVDIEHQS